MDATFYGRPATLLDHQTALHRRLGRQLVQLVRAEPEGREGQVELGRVGQLQYALLVHIRHEVGLYNTSGGYGEW